MTHASLFSGIGGFDLAAEWMGWTNVFHCEFDPFCQKVLAYHFPNSKLYNDVRTFDATKYRGRIDVLSGGFPCQPFSVAGPRKGTDDPRHLWPSMLRIIREVQPRYVLGENVSGILSWSSGMVFEQVCTDLEDAGYEVTPYILPACGVNAPHRRNRVWFVAHAHDERTERASRRHEGESGSQGVQERDEVQLSDESDNLRELSADSDRELQERRDGNREDGWSEQTERTEPLSEPRGWEEFPTQPPICGGDDGLPSELDGITFPKWRNESVKSYGNAIVPQVALQIFKAISLDKHTGL
jgi:DNA (cytosine-5)-methyltransferase 1